MSDSVSVFVDTNVLVYARDSSEPEKQPLAAEWLAHLWRTRRGRLSMQVLHEYYVTVTHKLRPGLAPAVARADVADLVLWEPVRPNIEMLRSAWSLQDRFELALWDALIVAAAQSSGCSFLLTEDLQDGQDLGGVVVVDPFVHLPESLSHS